MSLYGILSSEFLSPNDNGFNLILFHLAIHVVYNITMALRHRRSAKKQ